MTIILSTNSLNDDSDLSQLSSSSSSLDCDLTKGPPQHPSGISTEDQELIKSLRSLMKNQLTPYYDTDFNLLRWIQGNRELTISEIGKKLRAHLKMRKSSWNLDKMARKPRTHSILKHWVHGITGESKKLENVIINVEQAGHIDYWGMRETFSVQQVLKARTQDMEDMLAKVMQMEAKTGKQAWILFILDMTGLKYDKRLLHLIRFEMRALTEYMATHYVELINAFVLVNAPSFICGVWNIAKAVLPERTRQKVRILSSTDWRNEILEYATPDVLPAKWNSLESSLFKAKLEHPPVYPPGNYYKLKNKEQATCGMEKWKIVAGKTLFITKEVRKGESLEWFIVADSDFGMGVFFTKRKDEQDIENMEVAYPCLGWMPSGPHACPVSDFVTVLEDGFLKVWLSNQHSWWTTLNIRARLHVLAADAL